MRDKLTYWGMTGFAMLALLFVIAGIVIHNQNRALRLEIEQRQQQINAAQSLLQIYQGMVQNLAAASGGGKDPQIQALLEQEGLKFEPPAEAKPAAPAPAAAPKK